MSKRAQLTVRVEFAGTVLDGVIVKGEAYAAMRPIVEGMGLEWARQLQRIQTDPVLGVNCVHMYTVGADNKQRSMLCIPEKYLQGWLFRVNPNKVKPSLREKVIHYQRECYEVLHQAFTTGRAETQQRVLAVQSKRDAGKLMADVINDTLLMDGKTPKHYHFSNEHLMVNEVFTGVRGPIDESTLTPAELRHLEALRRRNAIYVARGLSYDERKAALYQYQRELAANDHQGRLSA